MEAAPVASGRASATAAFRSRDFRLLWSGQTVSLVGDGAFLIALGWRTTALTGKSSSLAIVLMVHGLALVGPALAGGIYGAAGSSSVFGFDAASFVVSAALLFLARPRVFQRESSEGTLSEIAAGARYVMSVPWLWIGIFVSAFVLMVAMAPYQALLPKFVQGQFHRGVGSYGLLFAVQSLGMAAGTLLFGRVNPRRRRVIQIFGFLALNDLFVIGLALVPSFAAGAAFVTIRGVFIGYAITAWGTLLMEQVPESKLSRVTSLDFFGSSGLVPVGYALTAVASSFASPATILIAGFSLAFVLWSAPLASRTFRKAA